MDISLLQTHPEIAKSITVNVNGNDLIVFAEKLISETSKKIQEGIKKDSIPVTYLTRNETAKILNVSLTTLWHYDKKGILKPLRIGNKVRYKRSDVDLAFTEIIRKP